MEVMVVALVFLIAVALPTFLGAKARAGERRTQAQLRTALTAGLTYWTDGDITAFDLGCSAVPDDCGTADLVEASIAWAAPGAPTQPEVSIVYSTGNNLLLVSRGRARGVCRWLGNALGSPSPSRGRGSVPRLPTGTMT